MNCTKCKKYDSCKEKSPHLINCSNFQEKKVIFFWGTGPPGDIKIFNDYEIKNVMVSFKNIWPEYCKTPYQLANFEADNIFVDSGGYQFFTQFNEYPYTVEDYLKKIDNISDKIKYFASMDYPCEPELLEKRGKTVKEHIDATIKNTIKTHELIKAEYPHLKDKFVPVIQGWATNDYIKCIEGYKTAGLWPEYDYWAVGSVCRRNATTQTKDILKTIQRAGGNKRLHAFGFKISNLKDRTIKSLLYSCDSSAWGIEAMYTTPWKGSMPAEIKLLSHSLRYRAIFEIYKFKVDNLLNNEHNNTLLALMEGQPIIASIGDHEKD
jgi:hypothetical protein